MLHTSGFVGPTGRIKDNIVCHVAASQAILLSLIVFLLPEICTSKLLQRC